MLVVGGQSRVIGRIAGPQAQAAAAESFVHGLNAAMYVGSGLTLIAAFIAFFGLKGFKEARARAIADQSQAQPQGQTPPVAVEV